MTDIVVVGSLNMDLVVKAERMPEAGETISGQYFETIPGGKGANQAAAAARSGGQVAMVGRVGGDSFGRLLCDNLAGYGVDVGLVATTPNTPTGTATIIIDPSGENRIIVVPGANGSVSRLDIDAAESVIAQAKALIVQFEVPLDTVEYAMDVAIKHDVPVVLNSAPAQPASSRLLSKASYLIANETEARVLSGCDVIDRASAQAAAEQLRSIGVGVVIVTLGAQGALAVGEGQAIYAPGWPVEAVDTTAAGDAFVGGFTVSLIQNRPLEEAMRYATAAGALAVTRFGAQPSLPTADEIAAFLRERS